MPFDSLLLKLTKQLVSHQFNIATAESCTGGLMASYLTELPGSSAWFERGFVTYSNAAKIELLGVDEQLIQQHGAVSEPVAKAMALGAILHSTADISLAITGIAGPGGGSAEKPVGTVWLAFATRQFQQTKLCQLGNLSRHEIRKLACEQAFLGLLAFINSHC